MIVVCSTKIVLLDNDDSAGIHSNIACALLDAHVFLSNRKATYNSRNGKNCAIFPYQKSHMQKSLPVRRLKNVDTQYGKHLYGIGVYNHSNVVTATYRNYLWNKSLDAICKWRYGRQHPWNPYKNSSKSTMAGGLTINEFGSQYK